MKGTVKWFNAKKDSDLFLTKREKMYLYTSPHYRWMVSKFWKRATK